ncbi:MAG: SpoIIE family protein phosphatase [Desulfovibrio sp.]
MRIGIAVKYASAVLLCCTALFAVIFSYNYYTSREMLLQQIDHAAQLQCDAAVSRINEVISSVAAVTETSADILARDLEENNVSAVAEGMLAAVPEVYGTATALDPKSPYNPFGLYCPYVFRSGDKIEQLSLARDDYDYLRKGWYIFPYSSQTAMWSEPYYDDGGGNVLMSTYSAPIMATGDGEEPSVIGVLTADLSLDWLQEYVAKVHVGESGYAFLVSSRGALLSYPDLKNDMAKSIFELAVETNNPDLNSLGGRMISGQSGVAVIELGEMGKSDVVYKPLGNTGWSVGVVVSRAEVYADVVKLTKEMFGIGIAGLCVLVVLILLVSQGIVRPLRALSSAARVISGGKLDAELPAIKSKDEVGELTRSFHDMQVNLSEHIEDLKSTTAAKERIESELKIARDIQMGILPKLFPAFPEHDEFDIYASIEPAREVGGDLYDFFFTEEDTFFFLIGDVSDKGVPAAFFMAVTKTLIKVIAETGVSPADVLEKVNNDLSADNESCMFVTLFCASLNLRTGEVTYASAGHNPPFLMKGGEEAIELEMSNDPIAGAMDGMAYHNHTLTLETGQTLFLYTDGVSEAMDKALNLYTEDRLQRCISACADKSAEEVVEIVNKSIADFTGGAEQSDDITMLALQYWGKNK